MVDRQAVFLFASLTYKDVMRYVAEHQAEFDEWMVSQGPDVAASPPKGGEAVEQG